LALGLAIIAAFSAGLAVTLTVIGLALVQGRSLLDRKNLLRPSAIRLAPILSACALIAVGSVVSVEGLSGL